MHILRPLDSRANECFRLLGVNWLSASWKRVQSAALAVVLLEREGVAEAIMRACAERLGASYGSWVDLLRQQVATQASAMSIRSVRMHASNTANRCHHNYIGTEHLMVSCLTIDATLLDDSVPNMAQVYWAEMQAFFRRVMNDEPANQQAKLRWPNWAPKRILRVDDFPPALGNDAQLIVDSMSLLSKRGLLELPNVRYALSHQPRDVEEMRMRLVEYFCKEQPGTDHKRCQEDS